MANLDPAILAQFMARNGGGSGGTNYTGASRITTPEWMYDPVYQNDPSGGEGGTTSLIGYNQYKPGADTSTSGAEYAFYNPDGTFNRYGTTKEVDHNGLLAAGILTALTMGTMLPGAGATAGAGAGGVAGVGEAGWGMDLGAGGLAGDGVAATAAGSAAGPGMAGWGADLGMEGLAGTVGTGGVGFTPAAGVAGATGGGGLLSQAGSAISSALPSGASSWLGPAATAIGGLAGGQGTQQGGTVSQRLDPRLDAPVFGDLVPRTQGLLGEQMPQAAAQGAQMSSVGSGLLGRPIAGNGVGQVSLDSPTTPTNPYLTGMADDMQRRTAELLGKNNLAIQGNAVASGGLGGSRQGVAQGSAAAGAADSLQGQLASLYGGAYNSDQNRALQKYGQDLGFYTSQRGQDLTGAGMGSDLITAGQQTQWAPIKNAANIYAPFSGYGTKTSSEESGGGWQGVLGGALGAAQMGKNFGWW